MNDLALKAALTAFQKESSEQNRRVLLNEQARVRRSVARRLSR